MVIPAAMAEEVALGALEQEQREAWALERVTDGETIRDTYPILAGRLHECEAWREQRDTKEES
jgi:hypothetical protein